jgi:NAD(P)-dependent dehydrogenase (short-subunit alcohol dehydrogenase family)
MEDLRGRAAFITGGASGIGLALARAFVGAGMKVALVDLDDDALTRAVDELARPGVVVLPVRLDVTDRYTWDIAADRVEAALGPVAVLCCNAGVGGSYDRLEDIGIGSWQWAFDVNVNGTLYALKTFIPRMRRDGRSARVLITTSWLSLVPEARYGTCAATKSALVGIAETLRRELAETAIGVSLLCPGPVRTALAENSARLSRRVGAKVVIDPAFTEQLANGIDADLVGEMALRAVREDRFWIFTHPEMRGQLEARSQEMLTAMAEAADLISHGGASDLADA